MRRLSALLLIAFTTQVYSAPQFITFKEGKLGVNFGGYHAGVGIGGLLGGGAGGGLFAEAGTPHGQAAKAGLGGVVDGNAGTAGGLYAGATAGGNVKAAAGLGGLAAEHTAGGGFAAAQAGPHHAASGLGGASTVEGSAGFTYSGSKSIQAPTVVKEEIDFVPLQSKPVLAEKKVHTEFKFDTDNEIKPLHVNPVETGADAKFEVSSSVAAAEAPKPTVVVQEPEPQKVKYHEKHIIHTHYKPRRNHIHKHAYIGGFIGAGAGGELPPPPPIQKRIDVEAQGGVSGYGHQSTGQVSHEVTVHRNPTFFQDIFNIPISTLQAVGNLLSNTAGSTSVSVQKTASVQSGAYVH